jgi:glycosyltransferase involved in cell wall biosynthesis
MKARIKRLLGAGRPRVIAVIALTRDEAEAAVAHAATGSGNLPIWLWCAEDAAGVAGCQRIVSHATAARVRRDLRDIWPALMIAPWTGGWKGASLKLLPLYTPPFRAVFFNEALGFFPPRPVPIALHVQRRSWDALVSALRRIADWTFGIIGLLWRTTAEARRRIGNVWIDLKRHSRNSSEKIRAVVLALLAKIAVISEPLSRKRILAARRHAAAEAMCVPSCGTSSTEIVWYGRDWKDAWTRAIESSNADFIVLRMAGEAGSAAPLVEFAASSEAFAVALQIGYAGWRKVALNRHPFRPLSSCEVSQVLSPWSSLMVIRRDMLMRLGIPRSTTVGAVFAELYWRAGSHGLGSFVMGRETPVPQEPAMPLEDLEFAVRLPRASAAPASQDLTRGNVIWSPQHRRPYRALPRVLVVSPYLPFPLSHGGAVRIYNLCRSLAGRVDFALICRREANETVYYRELHDVFREVWTIETDEKYADPAVPKQIAEYRNSAMAGVIREYAATRKPDLLQMEYTQMAEYRGCAPEVPALLVEHDITYTLYEQLAAARPEDAGMREERDRWHVFERRALETANAVWTMSRHDAELALDHGAPRTHTEVIPNGVDLVRFVPAEKPAGPPRILFVGSFRHLPNLLACEALISTVMPEVWKTAPDTELHVIAGPNHANAAALAGKQHLLGAHPHIRIEGFVEDVRPAYRSCDVVAIPLPVSAGTNIKLMEAMACARAVVSTAVGCVGLDLEDGRDLLIREIGEGFAEGIVQLLRDSELRSRMAARARRTAENHFGWDAIADRAYESYSALLSRALAAR